MGLGDAKLMAMLAAWLGLKGAVLSFGLGIVLASIAAIRAARASGRAAACNMGRHQAPARHLPLYRRNCQHPLGPADHLNLSALGRINQATPGALGSLVGVRTNSQPRYCCGFSDDTAGAFAISGCLGYFFASLLCLLSGSYSITFM